MKPSALDSILESRKKIEKGISEINYEITSEKDLSHIDKFLKVISNNSRLIIEYSHNAKTGVYTPALNKVVLPMYITKDKDLYLLMGSHEISHVLHTPSDFLENHDKGGDNIVHGIKLNSLLMNCINIVEDIRIERLIRNKFPGFVSVYERGYSKLLKGIFNITDEIWTNSHIGDRINAKAKLGKLLKYELTTYEEGIYRYLRNTKDFNDVLIKSVYLYNILVQDKKDNNQEQKEQAEIECNAEGDNINTDPDKEEHNPKDSDEMEDSTKSDNDSNSDSESEDEDSGDNDTEQSMEDLLKELESNFSNNGASSDEFSDELLQAISDIIETLDELSDSDMTDLSSNMMDEAKNAYIDEQISTNSGINFNPHYISTYKDIVKNPYSIMKKIF